MIVGSVVAGVVGAAAGFGCCSAWLVATAREEGPEAPALRWAVAMRAFLAIVLAWMQLGLGSLFGSSLEPLLSFETGARASRRIMPQFGMRACLAAMRETIVVATVLALRRRGRRR